MGSLVFQYISPISGRMTLKIVFFILLLIGSIELKHLFTRVKNPLVSTREILACQSKDILSCSIVKINLHALTGTYLTLPHKSTVTFLDKPGEDSFTFHDKKGTEAIFIRKQSEVLGHVNYWDGRNFMLEPCNNFPGCHVWIEGDVKKWVDEPTNHISRAQFDFAPRRNIYSLIQKGKDDSTTEITYSVMVYYTPQVKKRRPDILKYVEMVIGETNQGYINSKIPIKVKLHCIEETTFQENPNIHKMLAIFSAYKPLDELRNSADAAVLLVEKKGPTAGVAYGNSFWSGRTISVSQMDNALWYYTFGHEIGHNIGADHDNTINEYYPYGHGKLITGTNSRTIMAYPASGFPRRVNWWSNPDVKYQGKPTGTNKRNNARLWREHRFALAAIGDESQACRTIEPSKSGVITSPNYPSNYDNNMDKTYSIQVAAGKKIRIMIDEFKLEDKDSSGRCYDYVRITKGDQDLITPNKICGTLHIGRWLTFNSNKINIIFHSDRSVTNKGFKITWEAV